MGFREWLKLWEVGTGTGDVAVFARPVMTSMDRRFPPAIISGEEDPFFKRRKKASRGPDDKHLP